MTTTPTEWNTNNLVNPSSTNFQGQQQIVGLSNGNFLVVFADDSGTVGTGVGRDIVGVIYNALGFVVESAFQLNTAGTDSTEGQPSIAATNDGGFMMAYQDVGGGAGDLIRLERYNASGTSIDSVIAQSDPGTALPYTPKIVVDQADNSVFMSYQFSDGNEDTIRAKHFDSNLNVAAGTPADGHIIRTDDDPASNPIGPFSNDTAILTNGVSVTVYHEDDTDQGIEFRRSNASTGANLGSNVNVNSTGNNGAIDYDPKVASLTGGGFVVVWVEDEGGNDNIKAQRYNSTGGTVGAEITVVDTGNNYFQPDVIGLEDGGFFIVARDSTDNRLEGTRYSASGTQVGTSMFAMETANTPQNPELSLHTDGRILVTWNDNLGDIRYEIWDPRDTTINADPGDGQITARVTDDTTLNGTSGAETLFGRNGDDTINPGFGNDSVAGGVGDDTVDYSFSAPSGGIEIAQSWNINLNTGVATRFMLGTAETDTLSSIENVIGSGWGDTITGNNGNNVLEGGNGNDSIFGMNGSDTIEGGLGNDRLGGGFGTDTVRGGVGDDTIFGFDGENIDSVDGGSGSDTVDVSDENGTAVTVDLGGGTWTGIGGTRNISSIETFIGTQVNDDITGGGAAETLIGREGNDTITGGAGDDVLQGDSGNDILNGGSDDDTLDGGDGDDTMSGDGGNDTFLIVNEGDTDSVNGGTGEDTLDLSKSTAGWNVQVGSATSLTSTVNHTGLERIIGSDFGDLVVEGTIDSISTGDGDDVVQTNGSNTSTEIFDGGAGFDRIEFSNNSSGYSINLGTGAFTNSLGAFNFEYAIGGTGDDTMTGSGSADTLIGNDGEDILMGLAGNDSIGGGSGDDTIDGGDDNDNLAGAAGNDSILGGDGDDTVNGGGNDDSIAGGMGNDILNGNSGNDRIQGGGGNDTMDGGSGHDILDLTGGASAGHIDAMAGTVTYGTLDTIANFEEYILGTGGETFIGRGIAETVSGGAGNDILRGNGGADLLMGGGNDDVLEGGQGGDSLVGGGGRDTATYENSSAGVVADLLLVGPQTNDAAGDTFDSIEVLVGSDFNDWLRGRAFAETLSGSEGNDTLSGRGSADLLEGGDGNDVLIGGGGPDVMNGGLGADFIRGDAGIDRIIFTDAVAGVTADLADQTNNTGEAAGDTYQSIEDVDGTDFDDSLRGDGETNVLRGRDGNDTLSGRGGDDTLEGGRGADLLSGGNGADQFLYTGSSQGPDTITDFAPGVDTIGVLGSAFGGLTPGSLPAAFFHVGSSAADANDFFVFDATTDRLFYDADGSGGGAQVLLATFTNNPSLNASDIEIV